MTSADTISAPHRQVLAIVGPTAVGKTAVAEEVAVRIGGVIVSADSMQVYRGMDIGTAKPVPSERRVAYHCLDLVDPGSEYSAALYQRDAREAIDDAFGRGSAPVVCGGTGLYLRAALDEMAFPPGDRIEGPGRSAYEALARDRGPQALHALLAERDPASAELLHPNNVRRIVRALEMNDEGVSYAAQADGFSQRTPHYPTLWVGLTMDRDALYTRINERVDAMVERGLLGEVGTLLDAGLRDALTATQAIGYKELVPVVDGAANLNDAVDAIKMSTRRYAKRQLTWFRGDPRVRWIDVTELSSGDAADSVMSLIESGEPQGEGGTAEHVAAKLDREG